MSDAPELVLIDGHALAYRAFHALPHDMASSAGEPTNATFGFASMLLGVIEERAPSHLVVTFDRGLTGRDELFPEYKANRAATPESLTLQMRRIRALVEALQIPIVEAEGWEADDVIGTLCAQASDAGLPALIVTGDTDTFQLIDDTTRVQTPGRRFSDAVIYDEARVRERYGVAPGALVEWKALTGDSSDNIPGVPGVGAKTATKLVAEHGTVDAILERAPELSAERLRQNLLAHADRVRLGRQLVAIRRDAPVDLDLEAARWHGAIGDDALELLRALEFRSLAERVAALAGAGAGVGEAPAGAYETVDRAPALERLAERLAGAERFAFDTETTSTDAMRADLVGISVSDAAGWGAYIPIAHVSPTAERQAALDLDGAEQAAEAAPNGSAAPRNLPLETVARALAPALTGPAEKQAHNAKYDLLVLRRHGIEVTGPVFDTMIAAWLINPDRRNLGLKDLAWSELGVEMTPITDLIGKGKSQISMAEAPVAAATEYAAADADLTLRLAERLAPELASHAARALFDDLEMPVLWVLVDMEAAGILVDLGVLDHIRDDLEARAAKLAERIHEAAGHPFNIGSPQQLGRVLFEEMGLPPTRRTKTGYSTAADALADLRPDHPIVGDVLDWRHLVKLKGTYVDALPSLVHPETGRIHTSWGQTSVVTGRIGSSEPNLQNIPVRTEVGEQIRRAFVAPEGHVLLAADYSQMELRILAALSGDPTLTEVFETGGDVHASTAAFLFDKAPGEVTTGERRVAKTVNFGTVYGISAFGLARRIGMSRADAQGFIDRYFERYADVRRYFDEVLAGAAEHGYVETIAGRRRYFPQLADGAKVDHGSRQRAEREAINAPLQGSAADITKRAMVGLHGALAEAGLGGRLLLQVHDELLLEVPEDELAETAALTRRIMTGAADLEVPLTVDLSAGPSWSELNRMD